MKRLALSVMLLIAPAPALADVAQDEALAESRLRGCLLAGSSAAPTTGLREAIVAVRSFCHPQIKRLREFRVATATQGLSGRAAEEAEDRAIRSLNDEIAHAIANFTGLTL